jgi:hypothetical protein
MPQNSTIIIIVLVLLAVLIIGGIILALVLTSGTGSEDQTGSDQTRSDQTGSDQTGSDQTEDQTGSDETKSCEQLLQELKDMAYDPANFKNGSTFNDAVGGEYAKLGCENDTDFGNAWAEIRRKWCDDKRAEYESGVWSSGDSFDTLFGGRLKNSACDEQKWNALIGKKLNQANLDKTAKCNALLQEYENYDTKLFETRRPENWDTFMGGRPKASGCDQTAFQAIVDRKTEEKSADLVSKSLGGLDVNDPQCTGIAYNFGVKLPLQLAIRSGKEAEFRANYKGPCKLPTRAELGM